MNPVLEAVLAVATLAGAVALLALADWLAGKLRRPAPPPPPVREVLVAVPMYPAPERVPYGTGGVYTCSTSGDGAR